MLSITTGIFTSRIIIIDWLPDYRITGYKIHERGFACTVYFTTCAYTSWERHGAKVWQKYIPMYVLRVMQEVQR